MTSVRRKGKRGHGRAHSREAPPQAPVGAKLIRCGNDIVFVSVRLYFQAPICAFSHGQNPPGLSRRSLGFNLTNQGRKPSKSPALAAGLLRFQPTQKAEPSTKSARLAPAIVRFFALLTPRNLRTFVQDRLAQDAVL